MPHSHEDHICPPSVAKWLNLPLRKLLENPRKLMKDYVKEGDTAIDFGCGGGFFTVELSRMVGNGGKVYAVDLQPEMLEITRKFTRRKKALDNIFLHQCETDSIGLDDVQSDFFLAAYVVHETMDSDRFFEMSAELMKPGSYMLVLEPKGHVSKEIFETTKREALSNSLKIEKAYTSITTRGMVLRKE